MFKKLVEWLKKVGILKTGKDAVDDKDLNSL